MVGTREWSKDLWKYSGRIESRNGLLVSDEGTIDKKVSRCSGEKEEGGCGRKRMCV